jgi:predicted transcriptional regulator
MKLFDFEDKIEEKIFLVLDENWKSIDEICLKTEFSQSEVLSKLTILELKSLVENIWMWIWVKI